MLIRPFAVVKEADKFAPLFSHQIGPAGPQRPVGLVNYTRGRQREAVRPERSVGAGAGRRIAASSCRRAVERGFGATRRAVGTRVRASVKDASLVGFYLFSSP